MALIECKECGKEYSDNAESCPQCSCPTDINIDKVNNNISEIKSTVKITGNEKYHVKKDGIIGIIWKSMVMFVFLLVMAYIFGIKTDNETITTVASISVLIMCLAIIGSLIASKNNKKAKIIFKYFKERYPIQSSVKYHQETIEQVTGSGESSDSALFECYMQAWKKGADAIIIDSNNTSTHVTGDVSSVNYGKIGGGLKVKGSTSSKTIYHTSATLVKYKK